MSTFQQVNSCTSISYSTFQDYRYIYSGTRYIQIPAQSQRKANSKTNHCEAWFSMVYSILCTANSHSTRFRFKRLSTFKEHRLLDSTLYRSFTQFTANSHSTPFRFQRLSDSQGAWFYSILHSTDPYLLPFRPLRTLAPFGSLLRTVTDCRFDVHALADPSDSPCMLFVASI